jgi:hypothetical protein
MTYRGPEFSARHGRREQLAGKCRPGATRARLRISPVNSKIISNLGSPFGSLTIISSYEKQWAQQGSNLRPLACKARTYRRWTWLDVARCGICQLRL